MKTYLVNANKALVLPDIHQAVDGYAKKIIDLEKGNYDHIICLGDYFDSHCDPSKINGIKETGGFVKELIGGIYGDATLCLGNHDAGYMESWKANQSFQKRRYLFNGYNGFSNNKSMKINKILSWEDWRSIQLFCEFGGHILSHAGIHSAFWNFDKNRKDNLDFLWELSEETLDLISLKPSRLLACGSSRGGSSPVGGLTWADFCDDFVDNEYIGPQLVGHTKQYNIIRSKGKSYCLDGGQTTYALLDKNGTLEKKSIVNGEMNIIEETGFRYRGWF